MYLIRPTRIGMLDDPSEHESVVMREHFAYLEHGREEGTVLLAGPSLAGEDTFGLVVLELEDEAAARGVMERDPAVASGVMSAELRRFRVSVTRS
jgi:uncharacterized protein YciI